MQVTPWIGPTVSFFGAVLAGFFALLAWLLNRRAQRAQAHEQINQRYDRLMTYRAQHPEVLSLAFRWNSDTFSRIYSQETDDDRS